MNKTYDIIIVGGGAAGMTAALYSLRSGKSVLLLEKETVGGQIALSPRVENFPSIKEISGSELADNMFSQIMDLDVEFELEEVENVEKQDGLFTVTTNYNKYTSKSVIIATGVSHRHIGVDREEELVGKGVSYCAVCDGAFYKDEDVVLIGDANTALQYSLLLSNYCRKVTICTLFDKFFGDKALVDRLADRNNIEIHHNLNLQSFVGEDELTGLVFENTKTKETVKFDAKAVFIAIGQVPHNEVFKNICELDKNGYIIADENLNTKTPGVFVCGDCRVKKVRQVTTATSDGAVAAVEAVNYIDTL